MSTRSTVRSEKPPRAAEERAPRSSAQRQGSEAVTVVMRAWEDLTDEERLDWRTEAAQLRKKGVHYFKSVNLRRLRREEALLRRPPPPDHYNHGPTLSRLIIQHRRGRLRLFLELQRVPVGPTTVWGSAPSNRGLLRPRHCPRLGWLKVAEDGLCEITQLYYAKYRDELQAHRHYLAGRRIFIGTRLELNRGKALFERVQALVPESE